MFIYIKHKLSPKVLSVFVKVRERERVFAWNMSKDNNKGG